MTGALRFTVHGTPTPQGSKRGFVVNGRAVVVDDNKKPLRTWRQDVTAAAMLARQSRASGPGLHPGYPDGPVLLEVSFYLPRPQWHYGTRGGVRYLKTTAPEWCDKRPDLDKLLRSTMDALTAAGAYHDDNQIAGLSVAEYYAGGHAAELDTPGAIITVAPLVEYAPDPALVDLQEQP